MDFITDRFGMCNFEEVLANVCQRWVNAPIRARQFSTVLACMSKARRKAFTAVH